MCQFLSAIGFRGGRVVDSPYTDQHDLIIRSLGLHETPAPRDNGWVKLEYTSNTPFDISSYKLTIDETDVPSWVTDNITTDWERKLIAKLKKVIIISGDIDVLLGGKYLIGGDAKVNMIHSSNIIIIGDSAKVNYIRDSAKVETIGDSAE